MSGQETPIESIQNEGFRQLMRLIESSHERRKSRLGVLEGVHLVEAFWQAFHPSSGMPESSATRLHALFLPPSDERPEHVTRLVARILAESGRLPAGQRPRLYGLTGALFRRASQVENGSGPLAIIAMPRFEMPATLTGDTLYLDRVQDPGNVGSLLRIAAAAGLETVLMAPTSAHCWSPKVLRAAMGAHFALRILEGTVAADLAGTRIGSLRLRALVAPAQGERRTIDLYDADLRAPTLWLCGHEGQGLSDQWLSDERVEQVVIAQQPGVESLNVAAAVAIALFEQRRQRR